MELHEIVGIPMPAMQDETTQASDIITQECIQQRSRDIPHENLHHPSLDTYADVLVPRTSGTIAELDGGNLRESVQEVCAYPSARNGEIRSTCYARCDDLG